MARAPARRRSPLYLALLILATCVPPGQLPVEYNLAAGLLVGLSNPQASPPGANDFSCRPSAEHPRPVILVHGTLANAPDSWNALAPLLKNNGYCVFALNYGGPPILGVSFGLADIAASAAELAAYVDQVLAATGAAKVDIVGHSQGGLMPRYYLRYLGGAAKVQKMVGLAPSNYGTTGFNIVDLWVALFPELSHAIVDPFCVSCLQQVAGSDLLAAVNEPTDTVPGVEYTVIATVYDEFVTPHTNAFLHGAGVTNILLQEGCPIDFTAHLAMPYDHIALGHVRNALDPAHPIDPGCTFIPVGNGG